MSDDDLLTLSKRATDAVVALGIMCLDMPSGIAVAAWAPGQPWHAQSEGRTGEDEDAWALLDGVVAGKAVIDLRDDLTRAGALPLLVREAWGDPGLVSGWQYRDIYGDPTRLWWIEDLTPEGAEVLTETEAWVLALEAAVKRKEARDER